MLDDALYGTLCLLDDALNRTLGPVLDDALYGTLCPVLDDAL